MSNQTSFSESEKTQHGFTAVPRSLSTLLSSRSSPKTANLDISSISLPSSKLATAVKDYASAKLNRQTLNHSFRVFYFASIIASEHFPSWKVDPETLYMTALLHDIATTDENLQSTLMSFEFAGGITALDLLKQHGASQAQREAVAEAIFRHQDLGDTGEQTSLGALMHFATVFDNAGLNPELIDKSTIEAVVEKFPREGWTACFAGVVRTEKKLKPWSHTTKIEGFEGMVEGNDLMRPYD